MHRCSQKPLDEVMARLRGRTVAETATQAESRPVSPSLGFLEPSKNPRHLGKLDGVRDPGGNRARWDGNRAQSPRSEVGTDLSPSRCSIPNWLQSGVARARFLREARSAAAVIHEHVVTIHAVHDTADVPFLVMEYIVGVSLEDRIQLTGQLKVEEVLRIGMQAASGLAAAHAQGLVHRDIKPSNILLENGVERVKITDFGLARVVHEAQLTQTNAVMGTPQYMSPEQARGESVDHRSDLFSLGCVMYAMCTGRSPFRAETPSGVIHRVCEDSPRSISEVNPETPDWLVCIIDRLLAKKPEERFQSAAKVTEMLGQYLAHVQQPSQAALPTGLPRRSKQRREWRRLPIAVATTAVVLLLAIGGLSLLGPWNDKSADNRPAGVGDLPPRFFEVDIQAKSTHYLHEGTDFPVNNLGDLKPGRLTSGATPFAIGERYIQLGGEKIHDCPEAVHGIAIGRKAAKLHFLHGATHCDKIGKCVGAYTIHYQDGTSDRVSVVTGRHLRDWHCPKNQTMLATRAEVGWSGTNGPTSKMGKKIQAYHYCWENPNPDKMIASVDMERSELKKPSMFCLAITCDVDDTELPPESGLLMTWLGYWTTASRYSISIPGTPVVPIRKQEVSERLVPAGRQRVEIHDGSQLIRGGTMTIEPGHLSFLAIDGPQTLFPLPEPQPEPIQDLVQHQGGSVSDIALSHNGKMLATAATYGTVLVWRSEGNKWKQIAAMPAGDLGVNSIAFSPEADWLAVGGVDGSLTIWTFGSEPQTKTLTESGPEVLEVAVSPDGRLVVAGSKGGMVEVWDSTSLEKTSFRACKGSVRGLAFSPDGSLLATSGEKENTLKLWGADDWNCEQTLIGHTSPIFDISFSPDGKKIASASGDSTAKVWDVESGRMLQSLPNPRTVEALAFDPTGEKLAVAGEFLTVRIWSLKDHKILNDFHAHWSRPQALAFGSDGNTLISGGRDCAVRVWSIADLPGPFERDGVRPTPRASCVVHEDWTTWSAFSSTNTPRLAVIGMVPSDVRVYDLSDLSKTVTLRATAEKPVNSWQQSLAFLPGRSTLAVCISRVGRPQIVLFDPVKNTLRDAFEPASPPAREPNLSYATMARVA